MSPDSSIHQKVAVPQPERFQPPRPPLLDRDGPRVGETPAEAYWRQFCDTLNAYAGRLTLGKKFSRDQLRGCFQELKGFTIPVLERGLALNEAQERKQMDAGWTSVRNFVGNIKAHCRAVEVKLREEEEARRMIEDRPSAAQLGRNQRNSARLREWLAGDRKGELEFERAPDGEEEETS